MYVTYTRLARGFTYPVAIIDRYSRRVLAWRTSNSNSNSMDASFCVDCLEEALIDHGKPETFNTDQGSQTLLTSNGLICSMIRKGNCWESGHCSDAVAERFFLNLKMERVWQRDYANHAEARIDIANYIVGFYSSEGLHSVLGNLPPSVYERKMAETKPIDASEIT